MFLGPKTAVDIHEHGLVRLEALQGKPSRWLAETEILRDFDECRRVEKEENDLRRNVLTVLLKGYFLNLTSSPPLCYFMNKSLLLTVLLVVSTFPVSAAPLVTYAFDNSSTNPAPATGIDADMSASSFTYSGGGTVAFAGSMFEVSGFWNQSIGSPSSYFTFSLTPDAGYKYTIDSLVLSVRPQSSGPPDLRVAYSTTADFSSGVTTLGTVTGLTLGSITDGVTFDTNPLSIATSGTLYFRIWGANASSGAGYLRVDNIVVNGTVTPVPEPSALALAVTGAVATLILRRRRA